MATIRKRGDKWQVQVRRLGNTSISKSFIKKADAQAWARHMETEADRSGLPADPKVLERLTVRDILERYRDTVVPQKRGRDIETIIINAFLRQRLAARSLASIGPSDFASYRDARLKVVKPATINRELGVIQHAFDIARKEWDVPLRENPLKLIRKPRLGPGRKRRLQDGEEERLIGATAKGRNKLILPLVLFALETAMRRGEMLGAKWDDLSREERTLHIPQTKNGHARTIPLTSGALAVLDGLKAVTGDGANVFPLTIESVKLAWRRLVIRAEIEDLHLHDLRHEAISRFFEKGLSVPEVALISGHRDPRMLFRYTHLRAEDVVAKLG